jgi:hypothetical protein
MNLDIGGATIDGNIAEVGSINPIGFSTLPAPAHSKVIASCVKYSHSHMHASLPARR